MSKDHVRLLKSVSYYNSMRFSDFKKFFSVLKPDASGIKQECIEVVPWVEILLKDDLEKLQVSLDTDSIRTSLSNFYRPNGPEETYKKLVKEAENIFHCSSIPDLHLVDNLPEPFHLKPWDSMSVDDLDSRRLNIPSGIYYRSEFVTHCYYEFVIAHELVHWVISSFSDKYYKFTSPLEEGVCDLLGAYILYDAKILPMNVIKNLFIYNRALKSQNDVWSIYWKFCKQAAYYCAVGGLESLIDLVKDGRLAIDNAQLCCASGNVRNENCKEIMFLTEIISADNAWCLGADEYILMLSTLTKEKDCAFSKKELSSTSGLPKDNFNNALERLLGLGLVFSERGEYFQELIKMPENIKYKF